MPLRRWIAAQATIAALLAPWLLRPELRTSGYRPTGDAPDIPRAIATMLFGTTLPLPFQRTFTIAANQTLSFATIVATLLVATATIITLATATHRTSAFLALHALIPPTLLAGLTIITGKGYFHPRYVSASTTPILVLLAAASITLSARTGPSRRSVVRYFAPLSLVLLFTLDGLSLGHYHFDPSFRKAPSQIPAGVSLLNM